MRIKAAVARGDEQPLDIEALDVAEPGEGEILVRLVASGVSRSDLDAIAGRLGTPLPFVPGAEAAGIVERVGAGVERPAPGDAVLLLQGPAEAEWRRDGSTPFAATDGAPVHGFFLGQSSFATHLLSRAADALVLEPETPLELVAILGGEFLRGALAVLDLPATDGVVVITGGGLAGLAACLTARARNIGAVILADPSQTRRHRAEGAGASVTVPDDAGLAAVVRSLHPDGATLAIEASGTLSGRDACRGALASGGRLVDTGGLVAPQAAREGASRLASMAAAGSLALASLIEFFPFERVNDALAARADGAKPVLRFPLGAFGHLDRALRQGSAVDEAGAEHATEADDTEHGAVVPPVTA